MIKSKMIWKTSESHEEGVEDGEADEHEEDDDEEEDDDDDDEEDDEGEEETTEESEESDGHELNYFTHCNPKSLSCFPNCFRRERYMFENSNLEMVSDKFPSTTFSNCLNKSSSISIESIFLTHSLIILALQFSSKVDLPNIKYLSFISLQSLSLSWIDFKLLYSIASNLKRIFSTDHSNSQYSIKRFK
jgi:hypothetical protein